MKNISRIIAVTAAAVAAIACSPEGHAPRRGDAIVIDPAVTRADELNFDDGDRIGLTVVRDGEPAAWLENVPLTCSGALFTGDGLNWYDDASVASSLRAYYPYDASGEPSSFSVREDQRGSGFTASDLMIGSKSGVKPSAEAVTMLFRHMLARIDVDMTTRETISQVTVSGTSLDAQVDVAAATVSLPAVISRRSITAHEVEAGKSYCAITVPQSAELTFTVQFADGTEQQCTMRQAELAAGHRYTASLTVEKEKIEVSMSGQIEGWEDEELQPGDSDTGAGDDQGQDGPTLKYDGVSYPVATLADGRTWLAANLSYYDGGSMRISSTPGDGSGIWFPADDGLNAVTGADNSAFVLEHGYLYNSATAHGGSLAQGSDPVQGICPDGWHLPTRAEFEALKAAYPSPEQLKASEFGFTASTFINATGSYRLGQASGISSACDMLFWGSDVDSSNKVICFRIMTSTTGSMSYSEYSTDSSNYAVAVRCIKNQ